MANTCNHCNHWDNNTASVQDDKFGECGVLNSDGMQYVLPVIQQDRSNVNMVTSADFGCNQFAAA